MSLLTDVVSVFELGEATGATRVDSMPAANDLADVNSVTQVAGIVGNAAGFVAASDTYLTHTSNASLQTGDISFGIAIWFQFKTAIHSAAHRWIICKDEFGANREWALFYNDTADRVRFYVFRADGTNIFVDWSSAPVLDTWYFALAWHDATTDTIYLKINNGTTVTAATGGALRAAGADAFHIGAPLGANGDNMEGWIDQAVFAKKAWSTVEQEQLWNNGDGVSFAKMQALDSSGVECFTNSPPWQSLSGKAVVY